MKHQLDWFRRQLFGQKSEKRLFDAHPQQMSLGELPVPESSPPPPPRRLPPTRAGRAAPIAPQRASRRCSSTKHGCPFRPSMCPIRKPTGSPRISTR
jgi:hypothetical protein